MNKERELAINILAEFEELLERNNLTIPDRDREGEETEARIYGITYYNLEDTITELITKLIKRGEING